MSGASLVFLWVLSLPHAMADFFLRVAPWLILEMFPTFSGENQVLYFKFKRTLVQV